MTSAPRATRDRVEALNARFAAIAGACYDHRWWVVGACVAVVAGALVLAGRARIDNSYEAFFDLHDPAYLAYEQYREDFGSDEVSYILYEAPDAEYGVWNLDVMGRIARLTEVLEDEVPFVYEVNSLTNAELVEGSADGIAIVKLEDDFPATQAQLLARRDQMLAKPMLVGGLASADGRYAAIQVEMDRSSTDPPEAIRLDPDKGDDLENLYPQVTQMRIEEILARPEYAGIHFDHTGDVPMNAVYNRLIIGDGGRLDAITALVIALLLGIAFRSLTAALVPIVVVQLSVLLSVAFIAALGWKIDMSFGSAPTLLTAIGIAHSVHILSGFRARHAALGDRRRALVETVSLIGTPSLMTSATTAVGFASMSFVPIKSIAHSGVYNAFGVMAAFAMSFTLLMALLSMSRRELAAIGGLFGAAAAALAGAYFGASPASAVAVGALAGGVVAAATLAFGRRDAQAGAAALRADPTEGGARGARRGGAPGPRLQAVLVAVARFDVRHRRAILAAFAAVFVWSAVGISRIVVDSNWLDDFSDEVPLKAVTERVDRVMGGVTNLIYLFDAGEAEGIKDPAVLREMERVEAIGISHAPLVRKGYSLVDILKDLNQAFHGGDPAYYVLPESRELVAQYLLLYEMSGGEDAQEYVSSDYRRASVELRLALAPTSRTGELVHAIDEELAAQPLEATRVDLTGIGALWIELLDYIVSSQVQGFTIAFAVIALMMAGVFRSFGIGVISMLPNIAPVALVMGLIGWAGVFLDYSKISIAAVAMGIAVDDTIHLISRYRHEFGRCGNYVDALVRALRDVGRALLVTSAALVCGFLVLLLSKLDSQATYGLLLAITIVAALVADFLLLPALILTFRPFGPERAGSAESAALREAA